TTADDLLGFNAHFLPKRVMYLIEIRACKHRKESLMRIYAVRLLSRSASLLFALAIICSSALAQFTSAIEGTVTDPNGSVVPKAAVTIKSSRTGIERTVDTSDSGYFRITSLPAASFTIIIKASGFKTSQKEITLEVAQVKTLNIALEVGAQTAEVIVTTEAP